MIKSQEDDSDDEDRENDRNKLAQQSESTRQQPSVKSFLLSMPVPKTTVAALGALPSSGAGTRRSIVETNMSAPNSSDFTADTNLGINQSMGNFENLSSSSVGELNGQLQPEASAGEFMNWAPVDHNYGNYESYGNYGNYDGNWVDVSAGITQEAPTLPESSVLKMPRKRGRNEGPIEIVEVKQDELIKNRPREDQVKLTGIAFGPSYQPASTKGKPTKLHKRKHQIGSLYYDMKQKETELAERRSKGFLTKAETQDRKSVV